MNKVNEFKKVWYKGERELATLNLRYRGCLRRASTPRQITILNKAYDAKKAEIETRRIEALKGLGA